MTKGTFYQGKVALVIAPTNTIGRAIVSGLVWRGARVVLAGRRPTALDEIARELGAAASYHLDMLDLTAIDALLAKIEAAFGPLDIVINLAGFTHFRPFTAIAIDDIRRAARINFEAPLLLTRALLPHMLDRGSGVIVQTNAYVGGRIAFPFFQVDAGCRAGVATFCRAVRREIQGRGVRLVIFAPGGTYTESERRREAFWHRVGLRLDKPSFVAERLINGVAAGKDEIWLGGASAKMAAVLDGLLSGLLDALWFSRFVKQGYAAFESGILGEDEPCRNRKV
jgi:short-subunit dehydrogenase